MTSVTVGPVRFQWQPDGQDPGTGRILVTVGGYQAATPLGVTRVEWNLFTAAANR